MSASSGPRRNRRRQAQEEPIAAALNTVLVPTAHARLWFSRRPMVSRMPMPTRTWATYMLRASWPVETSGSVTRRGRWSVSQMDPQMTRTAVPGLKLVYSAPPIWAAAAHHDRIARSELAAAIAAIAATAGRTQPNMTDTIIAAACLAALDVALDEWQAHSGAQQLGDLIDHAIGAIASLT